MDKYKEECDSIETFRLSLANFATDLAPEKPLVFIVDELDRCNPTFAVKVLERIKHLFAIPHIVFVLAIDYVIPYVAFMEVIALMLQNIFADL